MMKNANCGTCGAEVLDLGDGILVEQDNVDVEHECATCGCGDPHLGSHR